MATITPNSTLIESNTPPLFSKAKSYVVGSLVALITIGCVSATAIKSGVVAGTALTILKTVATTAIIGAIVVGTVSIIVAATVSAVFMVIAGFWLSEYLK